MMPAPAILALTKRPYFGNRKPLASTNTVATGYVDAMAALWAPDPLFFVYGDKNSLNPAIGPVLKDGTISGRPAWFSANSTYIPKLNLTHLQNMISFAIRQGMTGYRGLKQDYILIAPPVQLIYLIQDILKNQLKTTNASDLESGSQYYGEQDRIDLGVRITLVADNYGTLCKCKSGRYNLRVIIS